MKRRSYVMQKRAESEEQTRVSITESTIKLHETLGPSQTSISAIAEHAGVRRSTVYRHFPDERALFSACTTHYLAANPLPDLARWAAVADANQRLRTALQELYSYYCRTQQMMTKILRDEEAMPIVKQMLDRYRQYLADARETLMAGRKLREPARRRVKAALGHALDFHVWRSLVIEQGLDGSESADLMCLLVAGAAKRKSGRPDRVVPQRT
jgi:AcrR family transcriptional regulator